MAHNLEAVLTLKDNMSATLTTAKTNLDRFGKELKSKGRLMQNFGNTVGYLGKDLLKLNAPFLALGGWATKLGIDFEAVTSEAQAIMGATKAEMDAFKDKAREVGAATSASATESMGAIKLLGQAGLEQKEILELTYPLVRLSEAGNIDMATSADLLTNSMKSAEVPMKNVGQYLDQIALSGNESNTSIKEQMQAWKSAGGSIVSANMKMSETNALFGILANRGVKASEAGNAVSRVFQNLNATSGEAGKAMAKLKIKTSDSSGEMRNKIDVLKELKQKTDTMTEADREHYLTMIGGKAHTESLKKMLAGLGDEYEDLESKLASADGALEKMAITMKDNLKGKLETLSSATEEFGLKLAESLLPRVEGVVDSVAKFVDKLNEMDKGQIDAAINVVLFSTKLALLLIAIGSVAKTAGQFAFNLGKLLDMFKSGTGLSALFGASGLKVAVVMAGLAVVILLVVKNWDKIKSVAIKSKKAISEFIKENVNMDLVKEKVDGVKESFGKTKDAIGDVGNSFKAIFDIILPILAELAKIIGTSILDNLPGLIESIAMIFSGIVDVISGVVQVISGLLTGDMDVIMDGFNSILDGGVEFAKGIWRGLISVISMPIEAVINFLAVDFPKTAETISKIWEGLKNFLLHPIESLVKLKDMASNKIAELKERFENFRADIKETIKGKIELIADGFANKVEETKAKWEELKGSVKENVKGKVELLKENFPSKVEEIKGKWGELKERLSENNEAVAKLKDELSDKAEKVKSAWEDMKSNLSEETKAEIKLIKDKFDEGIETVKTKWEETKTKLGKAIRGEVEASSEKFKEGTSGIRKDWDETKGKLEGGIKAKFELAKSDALRGLKDALIDIKEIIEPLKKLFKGLGLSILSALGTTVLDVVIGVITSFSGLITFFTGVVEVISGVLNGDTEQIMEGFKSIFQGASTFVQGIWQGLVGILTMPIEAVVKFLEGAFPEKAEKIRGVWNKLKGFITNPLQGLVKLKDLASTKIEAVKKKWQDIKSSLKTTIKGKVNAITDAFQRGMDSVKEKWESVKKFLQNPIKGTVSLVQRGAKAVGNKLGIGNNWQGTPSWRGGPTYLHEKGGEIFDLPGETRVYPHDKSVQLAYKDGQASVGKGNSVSIAKLADTIVVREEADIDKIADRLASKITDAKFNMA